MVLFFAIRKSKCQQSLDFLATHGKENITKENDTNMYVPSFGPDINSK